MSVAPISSTPAAAGMFNASAIRQAEPDVQRKAVAGQFEAVLIRQMLGKTMNSMLGGENGVAGSIYGDLLTDLVAQQLSAGQGLGLGRYIEQQLTPRGATTTSPASPTTSAAPLSRSPSATPTES